MSRFSGGVIPKNFMCCMERLTERCIVLRFSQGILGGSIPGKTYA